MKKILVVDDDPHIVDVICFALEAAGYQHNVAKNGVEALKKFDQETPDLVILDVGLPELGGLDVCKRLRQQSDVPILFLSARDAEIDRVLGLEIGGDDYVTKPFSPRELTARVGVILKRADAQADRSTIEQQLQAGSLLADIENRSVMFLDREVKLTALEFNILCTFISRPRMVFSRAQILETAYPDNLHVSDRTIDSHIRNIRAKLKEQGCANVIENVHGAGFRLGSCS